jgi:predicted nucleotidyltransferase
MPSTDPSRPATSEPPVGRRRLIAALEREPICAAYLFGSQASGTAGPLSDTDLAVLVEPIVGVDERFRLRLELIAQATRLLQTNRVDVIVLNDAPILLRHRVIRDGELLLEREREQRVRFETATILEYLDTRPLRAELARGVQGRLAEGTFGRR